jgi:hypothetical protein
VADRSIARAGAQQDAGTVDAANPVQTAAGWLDTIERVHTECQRRAQAVGVEAVLSIGRTITAARDALSPAEYKGLLSRLSFGKRMAEHYVRLSAHPVLQDAKRVSQLPAAVGALVELIRIPKARLVAALDAKTITPATTRPTLKAMLGKRWRASPGATRFHRPGPRGPVRTHFKHSVEEARTWVRRWGSLTLSSPVAEAFTSLLEQDALLKVAPRSPDVVPSNGMPYAQAAIVNLESIRSDDTQRAAGLAKVREWLDRNGG